MLTYSNVFLKASIVICGRRKCGLLAARM